MGFSIGGGFQSWLKGNTDAKISNRLSQVNADTGNAVRQASNKATAAQGNYARFIQSLNNNRALEAGGNAQEALVVNSIRGNDRAMFASFSDNIQNAEQAGHAAASAAAAGVDGNVVDMVNASTALRDSIVQQSVADNQSAANWDVSRRAGNIMSQMVSSLDNSVILDRLDYNKQFAQQAPILSTFARTLQGFFPVQGDGITGFRNLADSGYTKVQQYFNQFQNGDQTQYNNSREANTFAFKQENYADTIDTFGSDSIDLTEEDFDF